MNLKDALLEGHSLTHTKKISCWAAESKSNLKQLMQVFLGKEKTLVQRASWAVSKTHEIKPEWFDVYTPQLIACLENPIHGSVRRNSLRMMQTMQIPGEYQSLLIDRLFILLSDSKEESAVRAFAMTVAYNVIKQYPELRQELKIIIEDQLPFATPSFKSRANKIINKL